MATMLSRRALNRATLERQFLLRRWQLPPLEVIERLVGLQAQTNLVDEQPRTFSELGRLLSRRWPDREPAALAQAIRAWVPLVQVPPRGVWGASGQAAHTSVEAWLGRSVNVDASVASMVLRYLAAFGPASVRDIQTWSGLTRLREVFDELRPSLLSFRDEEGGELFDLPEAPRPDSDTPAPLRFLYDYENLLLSHADRSRFITHDFKVQGFTTNGPAPRAVLIDGFVNATWSIADSGGTATLSIRPFTRLPAQAQGELTAEGTRLLAFAAGAKTYDVQFVD